MNENDQYHVSSFVLQCRRDGLDKLHNRLNSMQGVEVHVCENSKVVLTIEGSLPGSIMDNVSQIREMPGVLSCHMVYHEVDSEEV